ncbi:molybdopterin-dependent oxidoreductase [Bacteroidota bacterium]
MESFLTACPRNCYSTCSVNAVVDNGRLVKLEPVPENLATPNGPCLKGLSYTERVYSPDRILFPLKKDKKTNSFIKISWKEALDTIADKLIASKNKFGAHSILYYAGSGTKGLLNEVGLNFWKIFGGCTTTYGDLCWPAGLEATRLTFGENKHNAPWDLEKAKLIIIWGKNPAETNIHQMLFIEKAINNGSKLVVIDPRRTQTVEIADLFIQPKPGTDGVLALGLANILIKNNNIDKKFIEEYVLGFEEFKNMVSVYSPDKCSEITDVPPEQIKQLASLIAKIKPFSLCAGFGMQRYSNGGQTMRAVMALPAITGNIGKPGAGWIYANLQSYIFSDLNDPISCYPSDNNIDNISTSISTSRLGKEMSEASDPPIKFAWVERGNPLSQQPDSESVRKAFRSLDYCVVIEQFMTDTAMEADIILPAKSMFEQTDIINGYWHPYILLRQKVIDSPGEVKPETEVYYLLAKKMGIKDEKLKDKIPSPGEENIHMFLENKLNTKSEISLSELKKGPIVAPGNQEVAFSDLKFPTSSGKIELYSEEANNRWSIDNLPVFIEASDQDKNNYPLFLMTPNSHNGIHSQFINLKKIREINPEPVLLVNPEDAKERNIVHNDMVKVFNNRGSFVARTSIDFSIKKNCISTMNGWQLNDAGINNCSFANETDIGHGCAFHNNKVEIEKI